MAMGDFFFGKTEYEPIDKNAAVGDATNRFASDRLPSYGQRFDAGADALTKGANQAYQQLLGLQGSNANRFNQVSDRVAGFDPFAAEQSMRASRLSDLNRLLPTLAGAGRGQSNLAQARLGYAGRPTSSYQSLLDSSRAAAAMAPIANSIFSGTGADTSRLGSLIYQQPGALNSSIRGQEGVYTRPLGVLQMPMAENRLNLAAEGAGLGAASNAAAQNFAGLQENTTPGLFDYVDRVNSQLGDLAGIAGQVMGGVMGGGGLGGIGGMMGGLGGGGGGGGGGYGMQYPVGMGGQFQMAFPGMSPVQNFGELSPQQRYGYLQQKQQNSWIDPSLYE